MNRVLEMRFLNSEGGAAVIAVANARENLTPAEVRTVMYEIIEKNVFAPGGRDLTEIDGAKIITRTEQILEL